MKSETRINPLVADAIVRISTSGGHGVLLPDGMISPIPLFTNLSILGIEGVTLCHAC